MPALEKDIHFRTITPTSPEIVSVTARSEMTAISSHPLRVNFISAQMEHLPIPADVDVAVFNGSQQSPASMTIRFASSKFPDDLASLQHRMMEGASTVAAVKDSDGILEHMRHALFDYPTVPQKHYNGVKGNIKLLALAHASALARSPQVPELFRFDHPEVVDQMHRIAVRFCKATVDLRRNGHLEPRPAYFDQIDEMLRQHSAHEAK